MTKNAVTAVFSINNKNLSAEDLDKTRTSNPPPLEAYAAAPVPALFADYNPLIVGIVRR